MRYILVAVLVPCVDGRFRLLSGLRSTLRRLWDSSSQKIKVSSANPRSGPCSRPGKRPDFDSLVSHRPLCIDLCPLQSLFKPKFHFYFGQFCLLCFALAA